MREAGSNDEMSWNELAGSRNELGAKTPPRNDEMSWKSRFQIGSQRKIDQFMH